MTPAVASPWPVFWTFVVCLLLFHGVLVYWRPLSDLRWKQVDYVWLGVAVLSLIATADDARHWFAEVGVQAHEQALLNAGVALEQAANIGLQAICSRQFNQTPASPQNLEAIVGQYKEACAWLRGERDRLHVEMFKPIADQSMALRREPFDLVAEAGPVQREMQGLVDRYERERQPLVALLAVRDDAGTRATTRLLGPLFLAVALALRITKVTGDLRNARTAAEKAADSASPEAKTAPDPKDAGSPFTNGRPRGETPGAKEPN